MSIVDFLTGLALQSPAARSAFFSALTPRLLALPPALVAAHLAHLLLARIVLLDTDAVERFLPDLLTPAPEGEPAVHANYQCRRA